MDITSLLSTVAAALAVAIGIAVMIVLAVVPAWMRAEAERADGTDHATDTHSAPRLPRGVGPAQRDDDHALAA